MLPGHVAGFYSREDCHIDLSKLAEFAKAQVWVDQAIGLDLQSNQVFCRDRPPINFDVLSIDIGSTPHLPIGLVGMDRVIPAKPVHHFLEQWRSLSHPHIFAVGDIATMVNHPRPKAGVFAVRQAKPLVDNLHRLFHGQA